ncbi:class I SAM-dependent methyltransferase [Actinomadura litoris]|uniref:class I SAM-dependent methyltransferase n=1 Tax=Actinomadura litoris TaxID=2678616 RepID=UPI0012E1D968|nr:class I SAM-dependent methyltransferase [Actinomadura litoris]
MDVVRVARVIYEHPLAYLLGIEGAALLRAFTGEGDRRFVEERLAEVRRLLDDESLADLGTEVRRVGTVEGYGVWAGTYDDPGNAAFDIDRPVVAEILGGLAPGEALDAACGTGRYARDLVGRGHRVIGVDSSPDMLDRARASVPEAEFRLGDLHRLPVDGGAADVIVCALALTHVADLGPVMAEFARVLRPGGHLVISDVHPEAVARGSVPSVRDTDGRPARLATHRHPIGDYLRAALAAGLRLRRCEEPRPPAASHGASGEAGPWELWPWSLARMIPEAAGAANAGVPAMVVWHFQA